MKGRLDDKDKVKARRGRRWCELLTAHDTEPWHYLMLVENDALGRRDISWWEEQSAQRLEDLLRRHEGPPLIPEPVEPAGEPHVMAAVPEDEQPRTAVPVFDLAVKAGGWGDEVEPERAGWAHIARRPLEPDMFLARIRGRSMEPGIRDGAWGLFRSFPAEAVPPPRALDNRRVVVRLSSTSDFGFALFAVARSRTGRAAARRTGGFRRRRTEVRRDENRRAPKRRPRRTDRE